MAPLWKDCIAWRDRFACLSHFPFGHLQSATGKTQSLGPGPCRHYHYIQRDVDGKVFVEDRSIIHSPLFIYLFKWAHIKSAGMIAILNSLESFLPWHWVTVRNLKSLACFPGAEESIWLLWKATATIFFRLAEIIQALSCSILAKERQ